MKTAPTLADLASIQVQAEELARQAAALGVVVTITRRPLQPLAQGHDEPVVTVYVARSHRE